MKITAVKPFAAIAAALHHEVEVAGIAAPALASFAERQQRAAPGADDAGDSIGVVAAGARHEDVDLLRRGRGERNGQRD